MVTRRNWTCTYCINSHHTQSFTWHIIKDIKIICMWCRKSRYTLCTGSHIKIYYTLCPLGGHVSPARWACIARSMGMYRPHDGHLPTNRSFQRFQNGPLSHFAPRVSKWSLANCTQSFVQNHVFHTASCCLVTIHAYIHCITWILRPDGPAHQKVSSDLEYVAPWCQWVIN
jgi:hypothetical protein